MADWALHVDMDQFIVAVEILRRPELAGLPVTVGGRGDPEQTAHDARAAVLKATGLHCSVGIGDNKVRAKIATEIGKPRGIFRLTEANWFEAMGAKPTRDLSGVVGPKVQKRLTAHGIETVRELADSDEQVVDPLRAEFLDACGAAHETQNVDAASGAELSQHPPCRAVGRVLDDPVAFLPVDELQQGYRAEAASRPTARRSRQAVHA